VKDAYALADQITFGNKYCRKDIGAKALKALK
jgi:phosphoribosylamine--glycine ligase